MSDARWGEINPHGTEIKILDSAGLDSSLASCCVICRRLEGRPYVAPPPPSLPEFRVKEEPPFTYVGIDFVGPLYVKNLNSPQQKIWICLYTCYVTRAIHLDLVPDLTTNAFLRCFRRFTARRGRPSLVVSDNGVATIHSFPVLLVT